MRSAVAHSLLRHVRMHKWVEQLVLIVCPSVSLNLKHQILVNRSFMQVFRYNEVCNFTGYKTLNSLEEIVMDAENSLS